MGTLSEGLQDATPAKQAMRSTCDLLRVLLASDDYLDSAI